MTDPEENHQLSEDERRAIVQRIRVARLIMIAGLVGVFWSGLGFDLLGKAIDFRANPGFNLFFGSIFLGLFGVAAVFVPFRHALKVMVVLSAGFLAVFVAGKLVRGELF